MVIKHFWMSNVKMWLEFWDLCQPTVGQCLLTDGRNGRCVCFAQKRQLLIAVLHAACMAVFSEKMTRKI